MLDFCYNYEIIMIEIDKLRNNSISVLFRIIDLRIRRKIKRVEKVWFWEVRFGSKEGWDRDEIL